MSNPKPPVPDGFIQGPNGALYPKDNVKKADLARDKLVRTLIAGAQDVSGVIGEYRAKTMGAIEAFIVRAEKEFKVSHGGEKGNVTLMSFDGTLKVMVQVGDQIVFNERFGIAQALIYECLDAWTEGANKNIVSIIHNAFKKDSEGNAIPARILSLKQLQINDPKWRKAMKALEQSTQVTSQKPYLRCYEKNAEGEWKHIALDISKISTEAA